MMSSADSRKAVDETTRRERSPLCETHFEEMASIFTHALGVILGIVALVIMIGQAEGDVVRLVSGWVFGGALISLYMTSTIYHMLTRPRAKAFMQWLDHVFIFVLIAGSYTPLTLVALRGPLGWGLLAAVWFLAVAGILLKTFKKGRRDTLFSILLYLGMGWLVLVAIKPLLAAIGTEGMAWIVAGGVFYSAGTIFYCRKKLFLNHAIWHLFVLTGSFCHVVAVIGYILKVK